MTPIVKHFEKAEFTELPAGCKALTTPSISGSSIGVRGSGKCKSMVTLENLPPSIFKHHHCLALAAAARCGHPLKGEVLGNRAPSLGPKSVIFMQFSAKNLPNNKLAHFPLLLAPLGPPLHPIPMGGFKVQSIRIFRSDL